MQNVDIFDKDASGNAGYLYTHTNRLSCRLATSRTTDIILELGEMQGRSVLDLACGDGFYTIKFWDRGHPKQLVAADAATSAVAVGAQNSNTRPIRFLVGDAHRMPFPDNSFDVVLVQSVLHHDHDPLHMLREAFRLAPRIIIHEPNGNNPGLKVIEKTSRYHIEHNEKSYSSRRMKRWVKEAGGSVLHEKTACLLPKFLPGSDATTIELIRPPA